MGHDGKDKVLDTGGAPNSKMSCVEDVNNVYLKTKARTALVFECIASSYLSFCRKGGWMSFSIAYFWNIGRSQLRLGHPPGGTCSRGNWRKLEAVSGKRKVWAIQSKVSNEWVTSPLASSIFFIHNLPLKKLIIVLLLVIFTKFRYKNKYNASRAAHNINIKSNIHTSQMQPQVN